MVKLEQRNKLYEVIFFPLTRLAYLKIATWHMYVIGLFNTKGICREYAWVSDNRGITLFCLFPPMVRFFLLVSTHVLRIQTHVFIVWPCFSAPLKLAIAHHSAIPRPVSSSLVLRPTGCLAWQTKVAKASTEFPENFYSSWWIRISLKRSSRCPWRFPKYSNTSCTWFKNTKYNSRTFLFFSKLESSSFMDPAGHVLSATGRISGQNSEAAQRPKLACVWCGAMPSVGTRKQARTGAIKVSQ